MSLRAYPAARLLFLGIDPGPTRSAWSSVAVEGIGSRRMRFSFFAKGEVRGNGDAQVEGFRDYLDFTSELADIHARVIVVESVEGYSFKPTAHRGGGQAVVRNLIATQEMVGHFVREFRNRGLPCVTITAAKARSRVLDNSHARDPQIAVVIPRFIAAWPKKSSSHARDAAMVTLAAAYTLTCECRGDLTRLGLMKSIQ